MMQSQTDFVEMETLHVESAFLQRKVYVDLYRPRQVQGSAAAALLLLNDGQDLQQLSFAQLLNSLFGANMLQPFICVGIHAGRERLLEYGTAGVPDYVGRGVKAGLYHRFVLDELLPFLRQRLGLNSFPPLAAAGFSLGGLAAFDLVWQHPEVFQTAGVFSGSLWWRSRALDNGYDESSDRIVHALVRKRMYAPRLRFYFTTGSGDETADRNGNGIIDAIDDTIDLIAELEHKGYRQGEQIRYINYEEGRHDIATWGRALPQFLLWGWGRYASGQKR